MMEYVNYEEKIRHALGVELVGLPPNFVMQAPSKLGSGGSDIIHQLLTRLKANTCKWQPVSAGDKAELAVKFANAKKKPRKVRSDKKARDDDAEEDKEEAPKKKNRKGSAKKGKDGGSSGKKSGGKRKRVEEEEEEEAPKRKKKKAKAAAADDDTSPPPSTKSKKKGASKPPVAKPAKTVKTKTPASRKRHTPEPDPDAEIINNSADDDEPAPKKRKSVHTTEPAKAQEAQDDTAAATAAATKRALEALMARRKVVQAEREAAENGVQKSKAPRHDLIIVPKPKALARIADSDSSSDREIVNSRHLGGPIGGTGGNGWMRNLLSHTLNAIGAYEGHKRLLTLLDHLVVMVEACAGHKILLTHVRVLGGTGALKIKKISTETPQKSGGKRRGEPTTLKHRSLKTQELPKHPEKPKCIVREVAATQVSQGARRRLSANWVQIQDSWKAHRDNHGPDPAEFFALQFEETTEISRIAPPSKKRRLRNTNHLDVVLKRARNETDHRKFSARGSVKAREMHSPEHNKSRGGVVVASLEEIQIWAQTAEIDSFLHLGTEQEGKALKYQPP
ncbi:hypothetical protein DFH09DRAFT_1109991 [Mycena vulgaris]|nr:hypothetical protein DFH09DRAFT_1109991 [Mycena vulgaris]